MKIQFCSNKSNLAVEAIMYPFLVHAFEHISRLVNLQYTGLGWDSSTLNLDVDFVVIHAKDNRNTLQDGDYIDDELLFQDFVGKKVLVFDEMHSIQWAKRKIENTGAQYVICNYESDKKLFEKKFRHVKFAVIPHCAEISLYKDYGEEKVNDILFAGSISHHYNFRQRLRRLMENELGKICKCKIIMKKERRQKYHLEEYAREINRSKITICTSSNYGYRLAKYVEIPLCNSLMAGDVPDCRDADSLKKCMCVLRPEMTDDGIMSKLNFYVSNHGRFVLEKKTRLGMRYSRRYFNQDQYAKRFVEVLEGWK